MDSDKEKAIMKIPDGYEHTEYGLLKPDDLVYHYPRGEFIAVSIWEVDFPGSAAKAGAQRSLVTCVVKTKETKPAKIDSKNETKKEIQKRLSKKEFSELIKNFS